MPQELLKELKNAGFPLLTIGPHCELCGGYVDHNIRNHTAYDEEGPVLFKHKKCPNPIQELDFYQPELSKLIAWCGKERIGPNKNCPEPEREPIAHFFRLGWGDGWFATYEFYNSSLDNQYGAPLIEFADTPEEAVAKLGIAIHKKIEHS